MGPCRKCQEWNCVCDLLRLIEESKQQFHDIIYEHRSLAAQHDADFQRFMAKVLG